MINIPQEYCCVFKNFFVVLEFELRTSHFLCGSSTSSETLSGLYCVLGSFEIDSHFLSPHLYLLSS
jgi:hypothetical protein